VTANDAKEEVRRILSDGALTRQDPKGSSLRLESLHDEIVASVRPVLWLTGCAALLLLAVAALNSSTLLLASIHMRTREFAIRRAIGATTPGLLRQIMAEVVVLVAIAAAFAGFIAEAALGGVRAWAPTALLTPRALVLGAPGAGVLVILSVLAYASVGCAPALTAVVIAVERAPLGRLHRRRHDHGWMVTLQIAAALTLLALGAAIGQNVLRAASVDLGAHNDTAVVMQVMLPESRYDTPARVRGFYEHARRELAQLPGVVAVGATNHVPGIQRITPSIPLLFDGDAQRSDRPVVNALRLMVTPGYFRSLGIPFAQSNVDAAGSVVVRADRPPDDLVPAIRAAVARIDSALPLYNIRTFGSHVAVADKSATATASTMNGSYCGPSSCAAIRQIDSQHPNRHSAIRALIAPPDSVAASGTATEPGVPACRP
jgi:hypothetical protein